MSSDDRNKAYEKRKPCRDGNHGKATNKNFTDK